MVKVRGEWTEYAFAVDATVGRLLNDLGLEAVLQNDRVLEESVELIAVSEEAEMTGIPPDGRCYEIRVLSLSYAVQVGGGRVPQVFELKRLLCSAHLHIDSSLVVLSGAAGVVADDGDAVESSYCAVMRNPRPSQYRFWFEGDSRLLIACSPLATVGEVKCAVASSLNLVSVRLLFQKRILADSRPICSYLIPYGADITVAGANPPDAIPQLIDLPRVFQVSLPDGTTEQLEASVRRVVGVIAVWQSRFGDSGRLYTSDRELEPYERLCDVPGRELCFKQQEKLIPFQFVSKYGGAFSKHFQPSTTFGELSRALSGQFYQSKLRFFVDALEYLADDTLEDAVQGSSDLIEVWVIPTPEQTESQRQKLYDLCSGHPLSRFQMITEDGVCNINLCDTLGQIIDDIRYDSSSTDS
jgi:hypothetical protein